MTSVSISDCIDKYPSTVHEIDTDKGAVIKYEADWGGRDCTGPPKILREECWVTKIFPNEKMGHENLIQNSSKNFQEVSLLMWYLHISQSALHKFTFQLDALCQANASSVLKYTKHVVCGT